MSAAVPAMSCYAMLPAAARAAAAAAAANALTQRLCDEALGTDDQYLY